MAFDTAIGHLRDASTGSQQPLQVWAPLPSSNPAAGNQLAMSAPAVLAFAAMHLADGVTAAGVRVLSAASARAMRERQVDHPGIAGRTDGHGLGWVVSRREGLIEHGGGSFGIESLLQLAGRLRLVVTDRPEAASVAARAGAPVGPHRYELRYLGQETFGLVDEGGDPGYAVQFLGRDGAGGAQFLRACHAAGRAAPRAGRGQ